MRAPSPVGPSAASARRKNTASDAQPASNGSVVASPCQRSLRAMIAEWLAQHGSELPERQTLSM